MYTSRSYIALMTTVSGVNQCIAFLEQSGPGYILAPGGVSTHLCRATILYSPTNGLWRLESNLLTCYASIK